MDNIELLAFKNNFEPAIISLPYVKTCLIDINKDKLSFNIIIDENIYIAYKLMQPISVEEIIEKWIGRPYLPKEFNIKYE